MYHQPGFYGGAHEIQGGGEAYGVHHQSDINYSDLSLMGHEVIPTSSMGIDLDFELSRQFGFDMKHELNYSNHCLDPSTILSNPSMFRMMNPLYDARVQLGLHNDGFNSMPNECGFLSGPRVASFSGGLDEGYDRKEIESQQIKGRKKKKGGAKDEKHEKQRREKLSKKFQVLKGFIPNPTKTDRATIVADTISYINELLRTIDELKLLVENKHEREERSKRVATGDPSTIPLMADECTDGFKRALRSSWLQRKSKETTVDVRIIEDEAIIKLTQRRKSNVLRSVSKALDELQLELLHLSGGNIGDYHIFLFNTKIHEGSSVYASAIAKKIIEVVDLQCPPCAC